MSLPTVGARAQPRAPTRVLRARSSSSGKSTPASSSVADVGAIAAAPARSRASSSSAEQVDRSRRARCGAASWRPAHEREQRAVVAQQREIGLRVAAVDGEDERAHRQRLARRSRSSSSPAISSWPISGCASSALRAVDAVAVTAARAASRS